MRPRKFYHDISFTQISKIHLVCRTLCSGEPCLLDHRRSSRPACPSTFRWHGRSQPCFDFISIAETLSGHHIAPSDIWFPPSCISNEKLAEQHHMTLFSETAEDAVPPSAPSARATHMRLLRLSASVQEDHLKWEPPRDTLSVRSRQTCRCQSRCFFFRTSSIAGHTSFA